MTQEIVEVATSQGRSSIKVHTLGATILSWRRDDQEQLFTPDTANLDGSEPIRGGVGLIFPVWGDAASQHTQALLDVPQAQRDQIACLPLHGLARSSTFELFELPHEGDAAAGEVQLGFRFDSGTDVRWKAAYPWRVILELIVVLSDVEATLKTSFRVRHLSALGDEPGEHPALFNAAFVNHLFSPTPDCAIVSGLQGATYLEGARGATKGDNEPGLTLACGPVHDTHRIYPELESRIVSFEDPATARKVEIRRGHYLCDIAVCSTGKLTAPEFPEYLALAPGHLVGFEQLLPDRVVSIHPTYTVIPC